MTKQNTIVNLNFSQNLRHLFQKRRVLCLFACRALRCVDAEHMARDGLADMDREAAEEDGQEGGQPCEVFEGIDKTAAFSAVAQDDEETDPKPWKTMTMEK